MLLTPAQDAADHTDPLSWSVVEEPGTTWVILRGEMCMAGCVRLEAALPGIEGRAPLLVIDLREVGMVDSTAIRVLVEADERAEARAGVTSLILGEPARRLLGMCGLLDGALTTAEGGEPG